MEIKNFADALTPVRRALAGIDALVKEGGEHFNEAQIERAKNLCDELRGQARHASYKLSAELAQAEAQIEQPAPPAGIDDPDFEPQDGDIIGVRGGKPYLISGPSKDAQAKAEIRGQESQIGLGAHADDITRKAVASIERSMEDARVKDGKPNPGVTTVATGEVEDKLKGDVIGLATSEGDQQTAHTDDGSRSIIGSADTEALKLLTRDTAVQQGVNDDGEGASSAKEIAQGASGEATQFTESITADQPADEAAVEAGAQIPASSIDQSKPEGDTGAPVPDAGNLALHPDPNAPEDVS
jgi:hypothetical protein